MICCSVNVYFVCWELEANRCILFAERNGAGWKLSRQDSPSLLGCTACLTVIAVLLAAAAIRGSNYSLIYFTSQSLPLNQHLSRICSCNDAAQIVSNEFVLQLPAPFLSELCKWSCQMLLQATPETAFFSGVSKRRNRLLFLCSGKLHLWQLCMNNGKQREETHQVTKLTLMDVISSSEEYCVRVTLISQSSEDKAGSVKEVTEVTAGTPRWGSTLKNHQVNLFFVNHFTAMESTYLKQEAFFCFLLWWTCDDGKIVLWFYTYFSDNH